MSEHTPGPWRMSGHEAGGFRVSTADKVDRTICHHVAPLSPSRGATRDESLANARLIAQAWTIPALREALEAIAADAAEFEHGDTNAETFVRGLASKARAALKARREA